MCVARESCFFVVNMGLQKRLFGFTYRQGRGFSARSQNFENRLHAASFLPVCPSVKQIGNHWTNFSDLKPVHTVVVTINKI